MTGVLVTADAAHAQRGTARFLVEECHADYLVTIKGNQPKLRQAIAARLTSRDQLAKRQKLP